MDLEAVPVSVSLMRILQVGEVAQGHSHSILEMLEEGEWPRDELWSLHPPRHNSAGEAQVMLQACL